MIFFYQDFSLSLISVAYFFEQLGFTTQKALDLNIGGTTIALGCSFLSGIFLNKFGRRSTFTIGIGILTILQLCVGFLQLPSNYDQNHGFGYGPVSLLFIAGAVYNLTIGPFCYAILSEVPSISLRSKAIAVSISFDAMYGIVTNFITPYLVNPGVANARGRVCFMHSLGALLTPGISVFFFIWCYYRLPETKHQTVEERDYLFDHKVHARKFKGTLLPPMT